MMDFWAKGLENHRKEKIKKLALLISLLIILITIIVLIIVYIFNVQFRNWCDKHILGKEILQEDTREIEIDGDENPQVYAFDKYICLFRRKTIEFYNKVGTKVGEIETNINNAKFASAGRYLAICEQDGKEFYLIDGKEKVYENEVDCTISQINVSRSGFVSVVLSNNSYKSIVSVYNKEGKEIFKTNLVTSRVVDVSISQDSQYLAIAEVDISGILTKSTIQIVSIELAQTKPAEAIVYKYEVPEGKLIINVEYQEKQKLICMYNDSIEVLQEQKSSELVGFENRKTTFMTIELNNRIAILEEKTTGEYTSDTYVNIINPENKREIQYIANGVVKSLHTSNKRIAINTGSELHIISTNGFLVKKYISSTEINDIVMTDSLVGVIYRDKIQIINL